MNKVLRYIGKGLAALLLALFLVVLLFSVSPVFSFSDPEPFSGPDIFNPYDGVEFPVQWKRANFHTHTRVEGLRNECKEWPETVLQDYERLGYDILTFSNHNELTSHPLSDSLQVNVYEHGYSLFKFHKLVFGSKDVLWFDHLLPILPSQKQWQYDMLAEGSDILCMNHPYRTWGMGNNTLRKLTGYRLIELDSGVGTENPYWDVALSAGHYSFGLANDDCHDSKRSSRIGVRCSWLDCASPRYEDIKETLLSGRFFSMRVPDFGDGDWEKKIAGGKNLPAIDSIGVRGDTVYMSLSSPASKIVAYGQDHAELAGIRDASSLEYILGADEPYVRFTAWFDDGVVIYSNPFARYDSSRQDSPFVYAEHPIDWPLTVLFNLALAILLVSCLLLWYKLFKKNS